MNRYHRLSPFALWLNLLLLGCLLVTLLLGFALCLVSLERPKGNLNQSRHTRQIQSVQHWEKIGGYPIIYLDRDNCVLCPESANKYLNDELENFRPVAADIHYEGPPEICEQCSALIESAYGDPAAQD